MIRFVKIGPYRVNLCRVSQYNPEQELTISVMFDDTKVTLNFKNTEDRDFTLTYLDKEVEIINCGKE